MISAMVGYVVVNVSYKLAGVMYCVLIRGEAFAEKSHSASKINNASASVHSSRAMIQQRIRDQFGCLV